MGSDQIPGKCHTGKKFNEKKFLKTIDRSAEMCRLFMELYEYRKRYPGQSLFRVGENIHAAAWCPQWNEKDCDEVL